MPTSFTGKRCVVPDPLRVAAPLDWTQAVCSECWNERNPERQVTNAATIHVGDVCCYCGNEATTGIYVRIDPTTVPYSAVKRDA